MTKHTEGTGNGYSEGRDEEERDPTLPKKYQWGEERLQFIDHVVYLASQMVFPYSKEQQEQFGPSAYSLVQLTLHALSTIKKNEGLQKINVILDVPRIIGGGYKGVDK